MAEKLKYQYYDEKTYASPAEISNEASEKIRQRHIGRIALSKVINRAL